MIDQIILLFLLAVPVACIAWTITHEELFRELRDWCLQKRARSRHLFARKFFYVFTCEYCFSHYVAASVLGLTRFTLVLPGWRGQVLAGFSLVWIANVYMSAFGRLRLEIKHERVAIEEEGRRANAMATPRRAG